MEKQNKLTLAERKQGVKPSLAAIDTHAAVIAIYDELRGQLLERDDVLKGCFIALLAKKHLFMVGPPGVAKSLLTEKICAAITGTNYFEWLMDMHTKPENLFGPCMISKLKVDQFQRNTAGMLPESHIAFLDEIWKASGAILNTLLKQMDETRRFYNPGRVDTPLISLFGASNELPEDASLAALYDRFLLRYFVGDIVDDGNFKAMLRSNGIRTTYTLSLEKLKAAQCCVIQVKTDAIEDTLVELRIKFREAGFEFSPRRWRESIRILQAAAWFAGRMTVGFEDLEILANVFWNKPEDRRAIAGIVMAIANPDGQKLLEVLDQATEVHTEAMRQRNTQQGMEANNKLKLLLKELETLKASAKRDEIETRLRQFQRQILVECLGVSV